MFHIAMENCQLSSMIYPREIYEFMVIFHSYPLILSNMAMKNPSLIDDFPINKCIEIDKNRYS